jgi:cleavage stimulation factor subunit 3
LPTFIVEITNKPLDARVVFETCVNRLVAKPESLYKAKALYAYFHKYEAQFGELSQISKLEDRMVELFPEDPRLSNFVARYSTDKFDPVAAPIIISKAVQMRPKRIMPTVEPAPPSARNSPMPLRQEQSPRPQYIRATASPKRPLGIDEEELNPPKRLARGASPLKGAAGRRLDQQRRNQASALNRDITFLLNILPPAHTYDGQRFNAAALTAVLRDTPVPDYNSWNSKLSGQSRQGSASHGRQPSGEFIGRPISPYGRVSSSGAGYRNSPLRTESGGGHLANPYSLPGDANSGGAPSGWPGTSAAGYGQPPAGQYAGGYRF